jgi:ornithine--oxo-acid transaminase
MKSQKILSRLANNYSSLPVNIVRGKDIFLWDKNGKKYVDLLAGYSAVNQGHCHPKIITKLISQANQLTLSSRVVNSELLYNWAEYITNKFNYENVLAMNSGAEAVETAIKMARKYGREILNIDKPIIVCLTGNFHGRTLGTISMSDYMKYKEGFGPFIEDIIHVEMNNSNHLKQVFEKHNSRISAILYEPIQGEGGIVVMNNNFITTMEKIKKQYSNILFMADEIQCGLGRVGALTASSKIFPNLKPDVLILGKALSGGILPMSCVLANNNSMSVFTPGTHGSTFGGNPLACAISMESIDVIEKECIPNVENIQHNLKYALSNLQNKQIDCVRGMGLFYGIQFNNMYNLEALRLRMLEAGYITCTSRNNTMRISPPLTICISEIKKAVDKLQELI